MTGVQDGRRKTIPTCLFKQVIFNGGFLDAIFAKGAARLLLGGRHYHAGAVNPNGAAKQKALNFPAQCLDQLTGAFELETDHIDHHIWVQIAHPPAKGAGSFLWIPVNIIPAGLSSRPSRGGKACAADD